MKYVKYLDNIHVKNETNISCYNSCSKFAKIEIESNILNVESKLRKDRVYFGNIASFIPRHTTVLENKL